MRSTAYWFCTKLVLTSVFKLGFAFLMRRSLLSGWNITLESFGRNSSFAEPLLAAFSHRQTIRTSQHCDCYPLIGTCSTTCNNMKLIRWPLMGGLLHLVQRRGDCARPQPARPLLAVPNVIAHPSTASVPITVLLYNGPLLCGFNVPIKWLQCRLNHFIEWQGRYCAA